jgi:hypothetical protein
MQMTPPELGPPVEVPNLDAAEQFKRKLWLDYLSKINDRELQQNHLSGVTDWVLAGVLTAIAYRGVPLVPSLLRVPGLTHATAVMFTLEVNLLLFTMFAIVELLFAKGSGEQPRILPKERRPPLGRVSLIGIVLAVCSFLLARDSSQPLYIHYSATAAAGFWMLLSIVLAVASPIQRYLKRKTGAELPIYTGMKTGGTRVGVTIMVAVWVGALMFCYALIRHIVYLQTLDSDWVTPLSTATQILVAMVIILTLYSRMALQTKRAGFLELERDVVLENLSADEIGQRFTAELVGSSMPEWIRLTAHKFKRCGERLTELTRDLQKSAEEIDSISPDFRHERAARADKSLTDCATILKDINRSLLAVHIDMPGAGQLPTATITQASKTKPVLIEFKTNIDKFKEDFKPTVALVEKLEGYAGVEGSKAAKLIVKMFGELPKSDGAKT